MFRCRGFDIEVPEGVYEPREDTELLMDAAEKIKEKVVLEIGCGSGIVSLVLARNGNKVTAVDMDQKAVDATKENAMINKVDVKCFKSNLFEKIEGRFDYILFNFPYLPEEPGEGSGAWAAGENLELIKKFAAQAKDYLKPGGRLIFVISSLTDLEKVGSIFEENGFRHKTLGEKKIPWEKLYLMEAL